jgi:hypothetical protein
MMTSIASSNVSGQSEIGVSGSRLCAGSSCAGGRLTLFRFAEGLVVGRRVGFLLGDVLNMRR